MHATTMCIGAEYAAVKGDGNNEELLRPCSRFSVAIIIIIIIIIIITTHGCGTILFVRSSVPASYHI